MSSDKVRIHVLGLSVSQLQSGAYALILAEDDGPRRIPVVIGEPEAQSIAIVLEGIRTPRPITHDLFVSFAHAFGVRLREVFIYRFEDGIFYSQVTFRNDEGHEVVIDARTSDAVALALRTDTPLFTTTDILERTGFIISDESLKRGDSNEGNSGDEADETPRETHNSSYHAEPKPENYTIEELERTLASLIDREEYEEAERVSKILEKKKKRLDTGEADKEI